MDNQIVGASGIIAHFAYTMNNSGTQTITFNGLGNAFGFTNSAVAEITHFDPTKGKVVTETFSIGGDYGTSFAEIAIGSPDRSLVTGLLQN